MDDGFGRIVKIVNEEHLAQCSKKLSRTSVQRYYKMGITSPVQVGPKQKVPDSIITAMNLHISMMQVVFYFVCFIFFY